VAKRNLLNPEQIAEFERYMAEWQAVLGLHSWRIERTPGHSTAMAEVSIDYEARLACYKVGNFGATLIDECSLSDTALHESLHILLRDLVVAAQSKDEARLDSAEHAVINTLEKLLRQAHPHV
jgi:hypothetical protein